MKKLLVAAFALALAAPSAAHAQAAYLGGRIGWAFPYGTALEVGGTATSQRDLVKSSIPLQADAGVRLGPIELGGYLSYGFAKAGSQCGGDCSAKELRIGVQAALHSPLEREREVWAGVLLGWERLTISPSGGADSKASGWQAGVQGGYDFAGSSFGFGPFVMLTAGQYDTFEVGNTKTSDLTKKIHGEFQVGVRGFFRL